jgi:hypothetical protein
MPPYSLRRSLWAGPVSTISAVLVGILYYGVTRAFGEQYVMPLDGSVSHLGPMPVLMPIFAILVPGLVASILFGLLVRFSRTPATVFLSVSTAALILSLGGPWNLPGAVTQTKILLSGMQVITAVLIVGGTLFLSHKKNKIA